MNHTTTRNLTIILTSSENFVWASMQEIIPHLERCWLMTASENHQVELINVDETPLKDILKLAINSKQIVITCFNLKLANVLNLIRNKMSISSRVIFHLHNQATIALWPLKNFGMLDYLNSEDIFISSCERDLNTLFLSLKNVKGFVVPFTLAQEDLLEMVKLRSSVFQKNLYYAGRISRQKNIHLIIEAIKLLKDANINIEFDIYGSEDKLGSPNMGMSDLTYLEEIKELINKYQLNENVHLHGHVPREDLYKRELVTRKIFITATSHSDENFGMALYRALLKGDQAVISDWGGHPDFKKNFKSQIHFFNITTKNNLGLTANTNQIKEMIIKAMNSARELSTPINFSEEFSEKNISHSFSEILKTPSTSIEPIQFTSLYNDVVDSRIKYKDHPTKIFEDYNDPKAIEFFKAYGLKV